MKTVILNISYQVSFHFIYNKPVEYIIYYLMKIEVCFEAIFHMLNLMVILLSNMNVRTVGSHKRFWLSKIY